MKNEIIIERKSNMFSKFVTLSTDFELDNGLSYKN